MILEVRGSERLAAPDLIEPFVRQSLGRFIKPRVLSSVTLVVEFTDRVVRENKVADVVILSDDKRTRTPRRFRARVQQHNLGFHRQLMALGHELAHVKQWVNGEWVSNHDLTRCLFNGKEYEIAKTEYYFQLWEVEARGLEMAFVQTFIEKNDLEYADWVDPTA